MSLDDARADVARLVRDIPNFPQPGVLFKDLTPLLADGPALARIVAALDDLVPGDVDVVAGVEARGFVLGGAVAVRRGCGFVPVRKAGKLPSATVEAAYDLEYGTARIEVHADAFHPGQRVVVLDDVLATGGTAAAACSLVERAGAHVAGVVVLLEIAALDGRARLGGRRVTSLVTT